MGIEKWNKQNLEFGFKSVIIKNAKSFVAVQDNKAKKLYIKIDLKECKQKIKLS